MSKHPPASDSRPRLVHRNRGTSPRGTPTRKSRQKPTQDELYEAYRRLAEHFEHLQRLEARLMKTPLQAERPAQGILFKEKETLSLQPQALVDAATFGQRDLLGRLLAMEAYEEAQRCRRLKSHKGYERWMKMVYRFLDFSLKPKRLEELEAIRKELFAIKAAQQEFR